MLGIDDSFAQRTAFEHSEKTSFGSSAVGTVWEGWQPQVLQPKQMFAIQHLQGWSTEGEPIEFKTAYSASRTLAHSLAGLAQLYRGAKETNVLSLYYSLINYVVRVPLIERRIDEQNIERMLAGFSDKVLREKVGYALRFALKEVSEQFSDLVAEVHAAESFGDGEITGQYNLLVIIKQERYSVIEVILKLADAIFGPLFLETEVLFGLTIMSEREWKQMCISEETSASDTVGRTVCLLVKE